jgi:hypothetical protein
VIQDGCDSEFVEPETLHDFARGCFLKDATSRRRRPFREASQNKAEVDLFTDRSLREPENARGPRRSPRVSRRATASDNDPATMAVSLDRGLLTIAGERPTTLPSGDDDKAAVHINERFGGRFRRVVSLSDDVDPNSVSADYHDGVLHIHVKRHESAQPRRITVQ